MKVLVVGSGGREHALVWSVARAGHTVYCAPGNAGISQVAECLDIEALDIPGLLSFARKGKVDLTVVGPEAPLVAGITDAFESRGLAIFGPSRSAARLEGDKAFAKELMQRYGIPTANFAVFEDMEKAENYVRNHKLPVVIKATGLAAGKGVTVARSFEEALNTLHDLMKIGKLGEAGKRVVIEEHLEGEEVSIIGLCDGKKLLFLSPSQDHKRLLDGDAGPNTGGMGAYAPVPIVNKAVFNQIIEEVFSPLLQALNKEGVEYRGAIYAGLMLTRDGPKVLEFNCRFGDPETQALVPLFPGDLAEACRQCALGDLTINLEPDLSGKHWALCVVAAARGYPGTYEKGLPISGNLTGGENTIVFHAGTKMVDEKVVTSGGRVLGVTGIGKTLSEARDRAYYGLGLIHFAGMHYRHDIGEKGLHYLNQRA